MNQKKQMPTHAGNSRTNPKECNHDWEEMWNTWGAYQGDWCRKCGSFR